MPDIPITVIIAEENVAEYRDAFLAQLPKPEEPVYSDKQWFAECVALYVEQIIAAGKRKLAQEAVNVDVTIGRG